MKSIILILIVISASFCKVNAQSTQIAVNTTSNKTTIKVNGFPKNTTVLIADANFNLLSVVSTDELGGGTINLNKHVSGDVTARTISGDIEITYKSSVKQIKHADETASITRSTGVKA